MIQAKYYIIGQNLTCDPMNNFIGANLTCDPILPKLAVLKILHLTFFNHWEFPNSNFDLIIFLVKFFNLFSFIEILIKNIKYIPYPNYNLLAKNILTISCDYHLYF